MVVPSRRSGLRLTKSSGPSLSFFCYIFQRSSMFGVSSALRAQLLWRWRLRGFDWTLSPLLLWGFPLMITILRFWTLSAPLRSFCHQRRMVFTDIIGPLILPCRVASLVMFSSPLLLDKPPGFLGPCILLFSPLFRISASITSPPVRPVRSIYRGSLSAVVALWVGTRSTGPPPGAEGSIFVFIPFPPPPTSPSTFGSVLSLVSMLLMLYVIWVVVTQLGIGTRLEVGKLLRRITEVATKVPVIVVPGSSSPEPWLMRSTIWNAIRNKVRWVCKQEKIKKWFCIFLNLKML